MAPPEDVGEQVAADPVLGRLARLEQLGAVALVRVPVARPDDPLREEDRASVRVDVADADDEVGVLRARRGEEHHLDRPDHLEISVEPSLVYESTSARASSSRWSHGPGRIGFAAPCVIVSTELTPPIVGTGSSGSYA